MALAAIVNGQAIDASQVDQLINLLTGVMNDQPVTLKGDNTRAPSILSLDSVNATIKVGMRFLDAGTSKWQMFKDTDQSWHLFDEVRAADVIKALSNGAITVTPDTTFGGRVLLSTAASKIVPGATSLGLRNTADSADNLGLTDAGLATLRNALSMPPSAGGTVAATSYGTVPVKIAETVLGANAATVVFSSIPQGFRALMGNYQVRTSDTAAQFVGMQCNSDTTAANYRYGFQQINTAGTSNGIGATSAAYGIPIGAGPGTGVAGAVAWGTGSWRMPHYADTTTNKGCIFHCSRDDASVTGTQVGAGEWFPGTTAAVSTLTFLMAVGNVLSGSMFTVAGDP